MISSAHQASPVKAVESSEQSFVEDVLEASMKTPVLVSFLGKLDSASQNFMLLLEKTAAAVGSDLHLVKVDIDKNPSLVQQLRIQAVPTVFAFYQGRVVDGFAGAVPEAQLKVFLGRLQQLVSGEGAGEGGALNLKEALKQASQAVRVKDYHLAGRIYNSILASEPNNPEAYAGIMKVAIATGDWRKAQQMMNAVPSEVANTRAFASAKAALELAGNNANPRMIDEYKAKLLVNANDHNVRFELAMSYYVMGMREAAVDELLEIVRRSNSWNDGAARKTLIKIFEAMEPDDPVVAYGRKRLSSILFS